MCCKHRDIYLIRLESGLVIRARSKLCARMERGPPLLRRAQLREIPGCSLRNCATDMQYEASYLGLIFQFSSMKRYNCGILHNA